MLMSCHLWNLRGVGIRCQHTANETSPLSLSMPCFSPFFSLKKTHLQSSMNDYKKKSMTLDLFITNSKMRIRFSFFPPNMGIYSLPYINLCKLMFKSIFVPSVVFLFRGQAFSYLKDGCSPIATRQFFLQQKNKKGTRRIKKEWEGKWTPSYIYVMLFNKFKCFFRALKIILDNVCHKSILLVFL